MKLFSVVCDKCRRCVLVSPALPNNFCEKCGVPLRGTMAEFDLEHEPGTKAAADQILAHIAEREDVKLPFYRMMCYECHQATYMFWTDNIQFCACCGEEFEGPADFIDLGKPRPFGGESE